MMMMRRIRNDRNSHISPWGRPWQIRWHWQATSPKCPAPLYLRIHLRSTLASRFQKMCQKTYVAWGVWPSPKCSFKKNQLDCTSKWLKLTFKNGKSSSFMVHWSASYAFKDPGVAFISKPSVSSTILVWSTAVAQSQLPDARNKNKIHGLWIIPHNAWEGYALNPHPGFQWQMKVHRDPPLTI